MCGFLGTFIRSIFDETGRQSKIIDYIKEREKNLKKPPSSSI
jgi:hypothetical protein